MTMIQGVEQKKLVTHIDDRGFFRELIRASDFPFFAEGFGQWSHSLLYNNVIKAWHYHNKQTDWWYVVSGVLRVGLCDLRKSSSTYKQTMDFYMGDQRDAQALKIPPGIAHGCKAIQGPVNLFYITSHEYDPNDEVRIAYNDKNIDFNWIEGPKIK